jgi:hypothetical protein
VAARATASGPTNPAVEHFTAGEIHDVAQMKSSRPVPDPIPAPTVRVRL